MGVPRILMGEILNETHHAVSEGLVEGSHVEVHSLVHVGPGQQVTWIELLLLLAAVLVHQVDGGSAALGHDEVAVDQGGDGVLGVDLKQKAPAYMDPKSGV